MKAITRRKTRLCRQIAFPLCGKQGKMNADIQAQTVADIGIIFGIKRKLVPVQIAVRGIVVDGILCRLPVCRPRADLPRLTLRLMATEGFSADAKLIDTAPFAKKLAARHRSA